MGRVLCGLAALAAGGALALAFAPPPPALAQVETARGPHSGAPLPRFVALKEPMANGRRRADASAPIDWVYERAGLPLQVIAENGPWRRVRDPDGVAVWMHMDSLENRATVFVRGGHDQEATLRRRPDAGSGAVALVDAGVVAAVRACEEGWVQVQAGPHEGWLRATDVWGATACV